MTALRPCGPLSTCSMPTYGSLSLHLAHLALALRPESASSEGRRVRVQAERAREKKGARGQGGDARGRYMLTHEAVAAPLGTFALPASIWMRRRPERGERTEDERKKVARCARGTATVCAGEEEETEKDLWFPHLRKRGPCVCRVCIFKAPGYSPFQVPIRLRLAPVTATARRAVQGSNSEQVYVVT